MSSFDTSIEDLPGNVMADVLSRLPVKTIIHSKCVCKNWRELVSDSYFVNLHLSRSPAGIIIHHNSGSQRPLSQYDPGILKWWEPIDDSRLDHDPVMNFDLNRVPTFENSKVHLMGSINGLVCFGQCLHKAQKNTCICNPVTREYTILPLSQHDRSRHTMMVSGFGIGLLTKENKVIRIFQRELPLNATSSLPRLYFEAEVYTLGKGQWKQLGPVPHRLKLATGTFLNGSIHWIVLDEDSAEKIYAFDIDNETFQLFPSPPPEKLDSFPRQNLGVMNGFLSLCYTSYLDQFTVWVMKEYGIKRSWHKEVVIKDSFGVVDPDCQMPESVYPMERSKDGTILKISNEVGFCFRPYFSEIAYRPSFLKLQTFESESVHVL